MPSIGDLVTNLVCDASQYTRGTDAARAGNKALSGNIDQIIGQLERQKKAMDKATETTQGNIVKKAADGADPNKVNRALQLNYEIEARRKATAAAEEARRVEDAATAAKLKSAQAGESLVSSLRASAAAHGLGATSARIYTAAQAGANREDLEAAMTLARKERAQRQMDQQVAQAVAGTRQQNDILMQSKSNTQGVTIAMQGLEDALAGATNNGLKGMIVASANNINQLSTLADKSMAWKMQLGTTAALIGVSVIPMIYKMITATEDLTEKRKEQAEANEKAHKREMDNLTQQYDAMRRRDREVRDMRTTLTGKDSSEELKGKDKEVVNRMLDSQNVSAREKERLNRLRDERERLVGETAGYIPEKGSDEHQEYEEKRRRLKTIQDEEIKSRQAIALADKEYRQGEQDRLTLKAEIAKRKNVEEIRERNEGLAEIKQAEQEAREQIAKEDEENRKNKLAKQKTLADSIVGNLAANDSKLAEKEELRKRREEIERARKEGVIDDKQKSTLLAGVVAKPDQVAGSPQAILAGTKEAYSSVIKNMRAGEMLKAQQEAAKNAAEQLKVAQAMQAHLKAIAEKDDATVSFN